MLFGNLHPDIFTLYSGSNRHLYEIVLVRIYNAFFRSELLFPTQNEVVAVIYNALAQNSELWHDEEAPAAFEDVHAGRGRRLRRRQHATADAGLTNDALGRARHIYGRLRQTGWLEESCYGLRVTLDMPAGAMRLAEFLCLLREGISEELGGLVIEVKNALEAVRLNARENAPGLHRAAKDAGAFGRYLRSVLSALRDIDRKVRAADSVQGRLQHYFEDFVERVLLKDYAAITTTSHPYRFRHRIFEALDGIEDSAVDLATLADAYREAQLAKTAQDARDIVHDDLIQVRRVFDQIEEAFVRIQQHRSRLETRLRNTVRYAGRRGSGFVERSEPILQRLDRLLTPKNRSHLVVPGRIEARRDLMGPQLLARPRLSRSAPPFVALEFAPPDPLRDLKQWLERQYLDRLAVTPEQVSRFLERRVPPFGRSDAASFVIDTIDDFLAFDALRMAVAAQEPEEEQSRLSKHLSRHFTFEMTGARAIDNLWIACDGFAVQRRGDHITREAANA
jgi:hypothetical protein